ncbi:MAG: Cell cycle serine/threonine-protein kinase cdc5/MSD2 [Claussenomyces sp. TS43310]|nr:MAG: Cell cycle serine/threonine-protein kinase cdc5/MSD2 [Claussenomyces sp. TS43310]
MDPTIFQLPLNWAPMISWRPSIVSDYMRRNEIEQDIVVPDLEISGRRGQWYHEISVIKDLEDKVDGGPEVLEILAQILCSALAVPNDCCRPASTSGSHNMFFFTNFRVIQIYCAHTLLERLHLDYLPLVESQYRSFTAGDRLEKKPTYESFTEEGFRNARELLIWECVIPDGIDMEAFSPRDANANLKPRQVMQKVKTVTAKIAPPKALQREKDHPPPPPIEVYEPPSSDRKNGAVYHTGKLLGKGGFAICYEGQLEGCKQKIALKIVKSRMPQKKMEQKFQTELQIHSKMRHANIVQFHRAFSFQQNTYIVLELCPNGSLMDMVRKRKFVTEPEVRFYTIQMAGAIKYMHSKGIIHRDLKMGNIFLDKDMNVKIGDFGLAAMLVSGKDMTTIRRTTLCGTPNYIAPEIVEKSKKGHDHAVDIWSLGIIIFAMLTGRPPFQSSTQDEIYRRAKERDYDWPKMSTSENYIGQEAKDLVAELLQNPEDRPNPDTIVQHPFFVSGWVPQIEEMSPQLRDDAPNPNQFVSVGLRGGRTTLYNRNFRKLCMKSDVGPYSSSQKPHSSTYKEVAAEEKAGLTPAVPLPEDVVYRPFDEVLKEHAQLLAENTASECSETSEGYSEPVQLIQPPTSQMSAASRQAPQSFAAQQRAQHQPTASLASARQPRSRVQNTTSQLSSAAKVSQPNIIATKATSSKGHFEIKSHPLPREERYAEQPLAVEARLGADLVHHLNQAHAERKSREEASISPTIVQLSLFHAREKQHEFPETKPDQILHKIRLLHAELERALNSRSASPAREPPSLSPDLVVKWVDYTNKFGLGYILSNGSVGCIFAKSGVSSAQGNGYLPPTCVLVRNAEKHLQNRLNENYADRHQLVPIQGDRIEFFENRGEGGICRVKVSPRDFTVTISPGGKAGTLSRGNDEFDDRKRQKIVLWRKFANYMTAFGKDQDYPYDATLDRTPPDLCSGEPPRVDVVTFYQRFGDVGCWAFFDGHFQFNFPDHTKVVLSADGKWCDFYHLPLEAARDLAQNGTLPTSALDDRQHLSYPLQTLLHFIAKTSTRGRGGGTSTRSKVQIDPMIQGIPQANDFRRKIEFIKRVVGEWVENGGIGNSAMDPAHRLRWTGYRECVTVKKPYKHVWTTVGARRGDERHVAWFDPSKPGDIVPDIEI